MDGEDWKNKSRPLNRHCTQISSVLHIPRVVIADCITDLPYSWKDTYKWTIFYNQSYNHTKTDVSFYCCFHDLKGCQTVESTRHLMYHWSAPSWWRQGSEPDSYPSLRLNQRAMKFLYGGRWLDTASITAQVHHVGHKFAMEREAWRQLVELHEPLWKNQQASRVSNSNFNHEWSRGWMKHQLS